MKLISCENMRRLVLLSAILLGAGILLIILSQWLSVLQSGLFTLVLFYLALSLIISSPMVMLFNLLLSLMPGARQRLEHCNH